MISKRVGLSLKHKIEIKSHDFRSQNNDVKAFFTLSFLFILILITTTLLNNIDVHWCRRYQFHQNPFAIHIYTIWLIERTLSMDGD